MNRVSFLLLLLTALLTSCPKDKDGHDGHDHKTDKHGHSKDSHSPTDGKAAGKDEHGHELDEHGHGKEEHAKEAHAKAEHNADDGHGAAEHRVVDGGTAPVAVPTPSAPRGTP